MATAMGVDASVTAAMAALGCARKDYRGIGGAVTYLCLKHARRWDDPGAPCVEAARLVQALTPVLRTAGHLEVTAPEAPRALTVTPATCPAGPGTTMPGTTTPVVSVEDRQDGPVPVWDGAGRFAGFTTGDLTTHRTTGQAAWSLTMGEWCTPDHPCTQCATGRGPQP